MCLKMWAPVSLPVVLVVLQKWCADSLAYIAFICAKLNPSSLQVEIVEPELAVE